MILQALPQLAAKAFDVVEPVAVERSQSLATRYRGKRP